MVDITTRAGKGSPLSHAEVDTNFNNLKTAVEANVTALADAGGVTVYSTINDLPLSSLTAGDLAYVSSTNRLYLTNGTGWYNIALVNQTPTISGNSATYSLAQDGAPTVVTLSATDPEGIPITWSHVATGLTNEATITNTDNVFTITPSTDPANAGDFSITFRASDGVNVATASSSFTLSFFSWNPSDFTKDSSTLLLNTAPYSMSRDTGVFVSSNGSHVAVFGRNNTTTQAYSWSLATNWDLSTASNLGNSTLHISGTAYGGAPWFSDDGLTFWVLDANGSLNVYKFTLTTPYNLSTANTSSYSTYSMSGTGGLYAYNIGFSSDGLTFWSYAGADKKYHVYTLTTAYDLSTATQTLNGAQLPSLTAIGATTQWAASFDVTGTKLAVLHLNPSNAGDEQWSNYNVPVPFDPTSITDSNLIGTTSLNLPGSYTSVGMSLPDPENMYLFDRGSGGIIIRYYI